MSAAGRVAFMGAMFALALALAYLESLIPLPPVLPPGVKLGLSNIVVMYCVFLVGTGNALFIAVLKSGFVLLTLGPVGAMMSLSGGVFSVAAMHLMLRVRRISFSYLMISMVGSVSHNMGQVLMAAVLLKNIFVLYSITILGISGVVMGLVTGLIFKTVMPYLSKLNKAFH